jgi:hypothetical protein
MLQRFLFEELAGGADGRVQHLNLAIPSVLGTTTCC